jgi:ATP-dependent RNA helicase HelY
VLAQDRTFFRLSARDFDDPPATLTRIPLPRSGSVRSARYRRDIAARLVALDVRPPRRPSRSADPRAEREAAKLERLAEQHPCHACPERASHERWAARASQIEHQIRGVERRIRTRTETLARQFERVLGVLEELGYVRGFAILRKGDVLARIYGEGDIVVAEALAEGVLDGLSPAETAAVVSSLVYESRERIPRTTVELPTAAAEDRYRHLQRIWRRVRRSEDAHHVELSRELDPGFATPIFHWAEGKHLDGVLAETGMAPGDFVRNAKQLLDLLRQIADVARSEQSAPVSAAIDTINRGVVAYTGV